MKKIRHESESHGISRRGILKAAVAAALAGIIIPIVGRLSPVLATGRSGKKVLIVYYSRTGNTREMAGLIRQRTGGDLLELFPVVPYPEEYKDTTEQAKEELASGYLPPLQPPLRNAQEYDVIFVGSPSWWATLVPPVRTFLTSYDLSGKTLIPFVTHMGSGLGRNVTDLKELCPQSTVLSGLALRGMHVDEKGSEVDAWLKKIGFER